MSVTLVSSSLLQRRKSQKEACRSVLKGQERETQQYVISGSGQKDLKLFILLPPLPPNFFAFNAEAKAGVGSHPFFSFFGHAACGILVPTQRWNLYLLQWKHGVLTTGLQGNPTGSESFKGFPDDSLAAPVWEVLKATALKSHFFHF